jgi:hypothetical protein
MQMCLELNEPIVLINTILYFNNALLLCSSAPICE